MRAALAIVACVAIADAAPAKQTIVVCSPGSPGSTDEARASMGAFAAAASAKAKLPLEAVYDPTEDGGVSKLDAAGIGLVSLPFFLKHEADLKLRPRLAVVQKGRPPLERWVLVGQKGHAKTAESLAGITIVSNAAYAPAFVRGIIGELGAVPANLKVAQSTAVLSSLRRAADGEPIAVLLDGPQAAALSSLPFAAKLEELVRSPEMPAGVMVTVDARVPDKVWSGIESALLGLASDPAGQKALDGIQIARFEVVNDKALADARKVYANGAK
jgi:hypothetical protein